jgi:hypothetical protein
MFHEKAIGLFEDRGGGFFRQLDVEIYPFIESEADIYDPVGFKE